MLGYGKEQKRGKYDQETASMVPPQFAERLHSREIKEGDSVRFTVRVTGRPPPDVNWYREGSQIVSSPDFEIIREGDVHSLYIPEAFYEDSGKFTIQAENPAGKIEDTAELFVEAPAAPIADSATPSPPVSRSPSVGATPERSTATRPIIPPAPPQFNQPLKDQKAREGDRVVLECVFPPYPQPDRVQWFRNEVEVHSSPDYQISVSNGIASMVIIEVFPEDAGEFSCVITISGASARTTMYLHVDAAPPSQPENTPQFDIQLTNQPLTFGQTAYFECKVSGNPPPEILWTRKGHPLVDKQRYKSTYDQYSGITTLTIIGLKEEDEGEYTCTALNSMGETSTTAMLLGPDRYADWLRQQQAGRDRNQQQNQQRVLMSELGHRMESPKPATPKGFYRPMSEKALDATAESRLSDVEGYPSDTEKSFKVSHFETRLMQEVAYRDGKVDPNQLVTSPPADRTAFDAQVPLTQALPPKIEQHLKNFQLLEGQDVSFVAKVSGMPTPAIQWFHNGRLLKPGNRYMMKFTKEGYCTLCIRVAFPEDAGYYTLCATNIVGRETTSAELFVEELSKIDDTSYVAPETLKRLMRGDGGSRRGSRDTGGVSEKYYKPVFRKVPSDMEVREGEMVRFDCVVSGRPMPEIFWYLDGVQVHDDNMHKIVVNESGTFSLIIHSTTRTDAGQYTCISRNRGGEDQFQVHLNVLAREAAATPRFIERLYNQTLREGQNAVFTCESTGVPIPMMSWQRDNKMLTSGQRHRIDTEGGRSTLMITDLRDADNAWYQCSAVNIAGTASNRARLIVQAEPRKKEPERKLVIPKRTTPTPQREVPQSRTKAPSPGRQQSKASINLTPSPAIVKEPPVFVQPAADVQRPPMPSVLAPQAQGPRPAAAFKPEDSPLVAYIREEEKKSARILPTPDTPTFFDSIRTDSVASSNIDDILPDRITPMDLRDMATPSGTSPLPRPPTRELIKKGVEPAPSEDDMYNRDRPRPPKFRMPLRPQLGLTEAQPARFESRLVPIGDPTMKVEWFKDGRLLDAGHRFKLTNDFGYVALDILYTYPEDNGSYRCVATNSAGRDTVEATLSCRAKISVIEDTQLPEGMQSISHIANLEETIRRDRLRKEIPEATPDQSPPVFDLMPEAVIVEEGGRAKFMCKVSGYPRPRITWWVNGSIVVAGHRFRLRYDGMIHTLDIPKARDYDAGTVRVVAKNPLGEAECSTMLTVREKEDWRSLLKQAPRSAAEVEHDRRRPTEMRSFELDQALKKPKTTVVELRNLERATQEKAQGIRDSEVTSAFQAINMQHAQMKTTTYSRQLRTDDPNVHVQSEVHIERARHMLGMPSDQKDREPIPTIPRTKFDRKDPPTFSAPMRNINAKEGQSAKLEVNFNGFPLPEVHWFKDGVEIVPSRDFQISTHGNRSTLFIPQVFPEDSGTYSVQLVNQFGMCECKAIMEVQPDLNKPKDSPPEFTVQMRDITIRIGEPATFDCQIVGYPTPNVYWCKDGLRLEECSRWKLIAEEQHFTLLIYEVRKGDQGRYEIVVTNKMGRATCSATLVVEGDVMDTTPATSAEPTSAPKLVQTMFDQTVDEGFCAEFVCNITASPEPVIQWFCNDKLIKPSKYFQMKSDGSRHSLVIAGAFPEDEGVYKCVARNPAGEVTCIAHLKVNLSQPVEPPVDRSMEPASFQQPLSSLNVEDGKSVRLEATVVGNPPPQVIWFKNGVQLYPSDNIKITHENEKAVLVIVQARPADTAVYTCRVMNPAGIAECAADVFVEVSPAKPKKHGTANDLEERTEEETVITHEIHTHHRIIQEVTEDMTQTQQVEQRIHTEEAVMEIRQDVRNETSKGPPEGPRITRPLQPVQVQDGAQARLECCVTGNPRPVVAWFHEATSVENTPEFLQFFDDDNLCSLIIKEVFPDDTGRYTVVAKNPHGVAMSSCEITVTEAEETVEEGIAPSLVTKPKAQVVNSGDTVTFECQLVASPAPEVTWSKDDIVLETMGRYEVTLTQMEQTYLTSLTIHQVEPVEGGNYKLRVANKFGELNATMSLVVNEMQQTFETIQSETVTTFISDEQVTEDVQPETITPVVQETQPETQIIEVPQDISVREGEPARFSCHVRGGVPPPSVKWMFEGRPVDEGDVYRLDDDGRGRHSLLIPECFPEDAGLYTVHVENATCELEASAYLTVRELFTEETSEVTSTLTIEQQAEAAIKIQAAFRGMQAREKVKAMKVQEPSGTPSPANPSQPITREYLMSYNRSESTISDRDTLGELPVLERKGSLPYLRRDSGEFESLRKESIVSEDDDYEVFPSKKSASQSTTERHREGHRTASSSSDFWGPDEDFLVLSKPLKRWSKSPQRDDSDETSTSLSRQNESIKYAELDLAAVRLRDKKSPKEKRLSSEEHDYLELLPDSPKHKSRDYVNVGKFSSKKETGDYINVSSITSRGDDRDTSHDKRQKRDYVNVSNVKSSGDDSNASYDSLDSDYDDHTYINFTQRSEGEYLEPVSPRDAGPVPSTSDDVHEEYIHPMRAGVQPPHPKPPQDLPSPVQQKSSGKLVRTSDDAEEKYLHSQVPPTETQGTTDSAASESEDDYLKPLKSPNASVAPALPNEPPPPAPPPPLDSSFSDDLHESDVMYDHFLGVRASGEQLMAAGGPEVREDAYPADSESESTKSESRSTWSVNTHNLEVPSEAPVLISDEEYIEDTESDRKHMLDSESDSSDHLSEMELVGSPEVSQIIHHTIWSAMKHSDDSGSDSDPAEATASLPPPTIHVSASDDDKVASRSEMCATDEEKLDKAKALKAKSSQDDVTVAFACIDHPPIARVEPFSFKDIATSSADKHRIESTCDNVTTKLKLVPAEADDLEELAFQMMSDVMLDAFQFITHPKQKPTGEAPSFVNIPQGINVVVGDTIYIECTFAGSPAPTVTWLRNEAELVGERYITTYEDSTTTLTIHNCVIEDQAEYTIRLMNEFGISELTIQVLIDYEMPRFDQPLQDTPATLDGTAVFECRVAGRPEPETKWHIFGVELTDQEKYYVERTETIHRLYIKHVTVDDTQMTYTVQAFNSAGFVESSANIILQGDSLASSSYEKNAALSPDAVAYSVVMAIVLLNLLQSPSLVFMLTVTVIALLLGYLILHGNLNM